MLTVSLVEDQERFRAAMATVLEVTPDLTLGRMFGSVEALRHALETEPGCAEGWDVVLMDLELPGENGLVGLRLLKEARPDLAVVMCTVFDHSDTVQQAIRGGADGYLVKSAPLPELLRRLREVGHGGAPLSPEVARGLLDRLRGDPEPDADRWVVASDGGTVIQPGGAVVDLRRRQAMRRILAALARQRVEHPGEPLTAAQCIEAGWPGERIRWASAQNRLWTTIRYLRDQGLEPIVETVGDGYRLTPAVEVRVSGQLGSGVP